MGCVAKGKVNGVWRHGALLDGVFFYRTTVGAMRQVPQAELDAVEPTRLPVAACPVCGEPMFSGDRCALLPKTKQAVHVGCMGNAPARVLFVGVPEPDGRRRA